MIRSILIDRSKIKFNERFNIVIPIESDCLGIDQVKYFAEPNNFSLKKEFHLTLIGGTVGFEIKKLIQNNPALKNQIEDLVKEIDWQINPTDKYFNVSKEYIQKDGFKESRESIIQKFETKAFQDFYLSLNKLLSTSFEAPYPHVTLYVKTNDLKGVNQGIGIYSKKDLISLNAKEIKIEEEKSEVGTDLSKIYKIKKIQLPTRPQVDTLITLFILRKFAKQFDGLDEAEIVCDPLVAEGKDFQNLLEEGTLLIDLGGSPFDHHGTDYSTASEAAAKFVNELDNPALQKLLKVAERSDKEGRGTISQDPLDRAFGFDGFVMALNKTNQDNPHVVIDSMMPLIEAHYAEQYKQAVGIPELWKELLAQNKAWIIDILYKGRKTRVAFFESSDSSLPGYLRAYKGEKCELIFQKLPTGHVNVMTRMNNGMDLKPLAILFRRSELLLQNKEEVSLDKLGRDGRINEVQEWYYDTVTNSILNGGLNPQSVPATKIPWKSFELLLKTAWK